MIYDYQDVNTPRGELFDKNGAKIDLVRKCDTETGVCTLLVVKNGRFVLHDHVALEVTRKFPAPLTFKPFESPMSKRGR
jgi:hypothetical protein